MTAAEVTSEVRQLLQPYVPGLLMRWAPTGHDARHMRVTGTLAFVDISGFTRLTERLARKGKVGAEEMSDILSATFAGLLTEARDDGADLVKWGGDAILLLFQGPDHALRAARAAHRMRATLRVIGRVPTTSGNVTLRMSVGVHSGDFDFFLVGDPEIHRELLISGPAASITADTEAAAAADQIGLSRATAALLEPQLLGSPLLDGRLLRTAPVPAVVPVVTDDAYATDPMQVLPPPIRRHLLDGEVAPEHRLITVAFVQFSGTDDLLLSAGATVLADALDEVVQNVQRACADHDVTFFETDINRDGGKIMLTAGAPRSADHDEERMLRVARVVLDRAGRLPLRIGINRGHVFSGDFGPSFRRTYSVKGDAINLAARVMGKAAPGQALATLEVVARSQTEFRTTELPPFLVKGKTEPVHAAAIGALVGQRYDDLHASPLVGRAEEMALLGDALDRARAGRGGLVEIVGDAGIGKSRLVSESSTAYFPFRRLLRGVLDVPAGADAQDVAARLVDQVSLDAPHLLPWVPLLGIPLDISLPSTPESEDLGEAFRKERMEEVLIELLGYLTPGPTALVMEDAEVMDDASAALLQQLVDRIGDRPMLVVVTRRDQPTGFVPHPDSTFFSLRPTPLDAATAVALVQVALHDHPMTPQALTALAQRGGGNPMFLEALVIEAARSGPLEQLPASVEGLVTSQIDRLDPADRTVLRYAAILGVVVDERALDTLLDDHDARVPSGAMDRLGHFLMRDGPGRIRFRNVLMRDVAYEGLPYRHRKMLHDRVGLTIERATPNPETQCELLSLHFFHAGRHERAWRYSLLSGERALAKFAHGEAIEFLARATQSTQHHGEVPPAELGRVYELLADSRWLVGQPQGAAEAYALARKYLRGDPVRLAGIIEKEARIDQRHRKHSLAMRRISRGLGELDGVPGREAAIARSLLSRRYAHSRFSQGRTDEALHWADRAADEAEEALDKDALAQAYEMLNAIYAGSGRDEPMPYGRLALQAYTELRNLPRQGHCLNNLATQDYQAGRWNESLDNLRRATDIFRRIGDTASEGNASYNQAELLIRQRRYDEAGALLPEVLRIARAVEDEELAGLANRELARALAGSGDLDAGVAMLAEARSIFESLGEDGEVLGTDLARVEMLQDAGHADEATEILERVTTGEDGTVDAALHRLIARQHLAEGRLDEARLMLDAGLEAAERESNRYEQGMLLAESAALSRRAGSPDENAEGRAEEILDSLGVLRRS
jgi:class 3 adenylate cyclase/tetratricopeptide (TPR) repeat protein